MAHSSLAPALTPAVRAGVRLLIDPPAAARGVLVAYSDRFGGISTPPFDSLNLGSRVGDERARVAHNRGLVSRAGGWVQGAVVMSRQVHGSDVLEAPRGATGMIGDGDGLVARAPGPVLSILTADCAAVALAGGGGVALVHAGWRGLVAGVVERGAEMVAPLWGAWIGPCIRACCYRVGPEVIGAFERRGLPTRPGRVDIAEAARVAVRRAGAPAVALAQECTACAGRYFSHRKEGVTGRQGAFAALLRSPDEIAEDGAPA